MTVPSREEAARLLLSLDPPPWHLRHSRAVAEIAGWLALRVDGASRGPRPAAAGRVVDRRLVEAAALLHDVDKVLPDRRLGGGPHGELGARWLAARGHPELGEAVELHPVTLLADPRGARRVLRGSLEARIVAYADKRAGQRLEPMAERFGRWRRRHPRGRADDGWAPSVVEAAWRRARELEAEVCGLAGSRPEDVGRLSWTGRAIARARA